MNEGRRGVLVDHTVRFWYKKKPFIFVLAKIGFWKIYVELNDLEGFDFRSKG